MGQRRIDLGIAAETIQSKLHIDVDIPEVMRDKEAARIRMLAIRYEHVLAAYALPGIHKEPFERLLIAQAHSEGLLFATRDGAVRKYGIGTVWN